MKQIRQHRNRTGGGPPSEIFLSEFDQKMIAIVGISTIDGDTQLEEMGFDTTSNLKNNNTLNNITSSNVIDCTENDVLPDTQRSNIPNQIHLPIQMDRSLGQTSISSKFSELDHFIFFD